METKLDEILDGLPEKPPRSRLQSFSDFIIELRRRTYREIARILEEKCQVRVSKSTVHRFLQARSRQRVKSPRHSMATPMKTAATEINPPVEPTKADSMDEVRRRIEELKRQPIAGETSPKEFRCDRDEPLHLLPETEKDESVGEK